MPGSIAAKLSRGAYLHVPFCETRCGYCDFNTYTPGELGSDAALRPYLAAMSREMHHAAAELPRWVEGGGVDTVFVGGGTPTLLSAAQLVGLLNQLQRTLGVQPHAEITTEANPDTLDAAYAEELAAAGFTRVSIGMQSVVGSVLARLDRRHDPEAVARAVAAVRGAGMQVSLDVIYGTPGETLAQWRETLDAVIALQPDHVSAYALTIEPGTAMYRRRSRGEIGDVGGDDQAAKYEMCDETLGSAGYTWYEISNWSRSDQTRCRHNVGYWNGGSWWGFGPGAYSGFPDRRWANVKHPGVYARAEDPRGEVEILSASEQALERVMLGIRLREGLQVNDVVAGDPAAAVVELEAEGLLSRTDDDHIVLTRRGRLLADAVTHRLT